MCHVATRRRGTVRGVDDYRRFFVAAAVSKAGAHVSFVAMPLVAVLTLDASPGEAGALGVLSTVAFLIVGLPAGAWLDRMRRRPVMITADVARAALLASVPVAWVMDALTFAQLYGVVLGCGVARVFFDVAAQSHLPQIVGRGRLVTANTQLGTVDAAGQVAGPAAGGWLVQAFGAPLVLVIEAVGHVWSAVWLARIRAAEPAAPGVAPGLARPRLWPDVREGVRFVRDHAVLRAVIAAGALTNVALVLTTVSLPLVLAGSGPASGPASPGTPEVALGVFFTAGGIGALLGSASARAVSRRVGEGRSLWLAGVAIAPATALTPLAAFGVVPPWAAAAGWAVVCAKVGFDNVLLIAFRQQVTPDAVLGRVNATARVLLVGAVTLGAALAGAIGETVSPRAALVVAAAVAAVTWLPVFASPLRHARSLAPPDPEPAVLS